MIDRGEVIISAEPVSWIPRDPRLVGIQEAYGCIVSGDSMEPAYERGNLLLVNPSADVSAGDDCLFIREADGKRYALLRRVLAVLAGGWKVRQYNPPKTYTLWREDWPSAHLVIGKHLTDAVRNHPEETALLQIIQGFLDCPEIADCAPEDKDPETEALESKARSILSRRPSSSGKGEERDAAQMPPPILASKAIDGIAHQIVRDVAELPDRTSPEGQEHMMLVAGDELEDIVRAALQLCASPSSPWQTMESAPKDGTELLLFARKRIYCGSWDSDKYAKKPKPFWNYSAIWGRTGCRMVPPSHWQPLPSPPSEDTASLGPPLRPQAEATYHMTAEEAAAVDRAHMKSVEIVSPSPSDEFFGAKWPCSRCGHQRGVADNLCPSPLCSHDI